MADSILYGTIQNILDQLASLAVGEILLAWGLEDDLKRLRKTLTCIRAVLIDAEEQRFTNHKISLWLRRLRDVLYAAEDVLADFAYEALRRQVISSRGGGGINGKVRRFFSSSNPVAYRLRIGHKIKEVRKRLDEIKTDKDEFNLNERVDHGRLRLREREQTNPLVNASEVFGRDKDREKMVELLLNSDHNVSVIPIVGIGGMGKTALAKLVYNDQRVADHFDSQVWVCLGDMKKFDVNHVLATINGQTSLHNSNSEGLGLGDFIREKFGGRRFLLVLDDLWDADRSKWLDFKGMLSSSARGSKILVTTRDNSVARCVGTVPAHDLGGLVHEQCISLFKELAFASEAEVDESLMKIGEEIVRKCRGVPLAVRTLGSLLFSKSDEREWISVRDSGIWQISGEQNDILAILKFSYDRLPFHLKLCFVICSVFPEDYEISDLELISLWTAHGLLKEHDPEYVGKQYIKEFLSRGFFQDFKPLDTWWFKMHDLVGDLARSLAKDEFQIEDDKHENDSQNCRHIWLVSGKQDNLVNSNNQDHDHVRSVIIRWSSIELLEAFSSKCNNLRLLWAIASDILELPKCVGSLKYLKCLKLDICRELKKLPESICKLHNLETLSLLGCCELEEIPKDVGELVNLRWLGVTTKQKHLPSNGIESLTSLQFLRFEYCPNLETLFEGTQIQLKSLRTLVAFSCKRLKSLCRLSGSASKQHSLPSLKILDLFSCGINDASKFLPMAPNLSSLKIDCLKELETLSGSIPECAPTLRHLEIYRCVKLRALPEWLPNLTSLTTLSLENCMNLLSLPQSMESLTALQSIRIANCGKLSDRCRREQGEEWLKIAKVPKVDFDHRYPNGEFWEEDAL